MGFWDNIQAEEKIKIEDGEYEASITNIELRDGKNQQFISTTFTITGPEKFRGQKIYDRLFWGTEPAQKMMKIKLSKMGISNFSSLPAPTEASFVPYVLAQLQGKRYQLFLATNGEFQNIKNMHPISSPF